MDTRSRTSEFMRASLWRRGLDPKHDIYHGEDHPYTTYGSTHPQKSESIRGYRGKRYSSCVHPVEHVRWTYHPVVAQYLGHDAYGSEYDKVWRGFAPAYDVSIGFPTVSDSDFDTAMQELRGEIPTQVLLPNFIFELPEALNMHKQLIHAFKNASSWSDAGRSYARRLGVSCANTHLLYQFGIKPLAGDIMSLLKLNERINRKIATLSKIPEDSYVPWRHAMHVNKNSCSVSVLLPGEFAMEKCDIAATTAVVSMFARVSRQRCVTGAVNKIGALIDASGISKFGSVLWEAIPFSFVSDWFWNAGDALKTLDQTSFPGSLSYVMAGFQAKVSSSFVVRGRFPTSYPYIKNQPTLTLGAGTVSRYSRSPGFPTTFLDTNYGIRQVLLSGSLAMQRLG